jgi:hypothetical protein
MESGSNATNGVGVLRGAQSLKEAGIECRSHDLRCTAVKVMTKAGLADHTIMARVGHVSPEMLKHYSRTRRLALNDCAAALQPNYSTARGHSEIVN